MIELYTNIMSDPATAQAFFWFIVFSISFCFYWYVRGLITRSRAGKPTPKEKDESGGIL